MYIPDYYNDSTIEEVKDFIKAHGFGLLITTTADRPQATHIPMEPGTNDKGKDVLRGHIAKANPQWKSFKDNGEVLVVFQGPHAYVSSSWYTHKDVPTWNYVAVHVYGTISIIEGEKLYRSLKELVDKYENSTKTYLSLESLPEKMIKRDMRGIVGFEIAITEVRAAFKLSQKKDDETYANIVNKLGASEKDHEKAISEYMKNRRKDRFSE